ncbi:MAG: pyrroline-5-carboxylate reductase [Alicyclobacillaceae bacterium]|nr:pyrroline-5-carboxylate reductase [Alicyclobacillaceae bacterium]
MNMGYLSFLGAGSIAEALIRGLLEAGVVSRDAVLVANRDDAAKRERLVQQYGIKVVSRQDAIRLGDVIILAMKPKDAPDAMVELRDHVQGAPLIISVLAGICTDWIEQQLGKEVPVVRAMPNTSCRVGESATALAGGRHVTKAHLDTARRIFSAVGKVVTVPEDQMDAVTGLSGSGPAYVYYVVEALIEAGKRAGLDEETSKILVEQTLFGAAKMLRVTGESPAELRRQVTSPGGTTMAGLEVLQRRDVSGAIEAAVLRAAARAREMREEFTQSTATRADR